GKTVVLHEVPDLKEGNLLDLHKAIQADEVNTVVIVGVNPVYNAPADVDFKSAFVRKGPATVIRLGYYEDETAAICNWHLPMAHYLESWGDALTSDGTLVPVQPLIQPLFAGLTE